MNHTIKDPAATPTAVVPGSQRGGCDQQAGVSPSGDDARSRPNRRFPSGTCRGKRTRAASALTYGLVVGLISLGAIVAVDSLGNGVGTLFVQIGDELRGAGTVQAQSGALTATCGPGEVLTGIVNNAARCETLGAVTAVTAGAGLTGSTAGTEVTLAVDFDAVAAQVGSSGGAISVTNCAYTNFAESVNSITYTCPSSRPVMTGISLNRNVGGIDYSYVTRMYCCALTQQ